ncbi:flagellar motor switch protein FliM [Priestia megaterium]|nr:flagellar motor switch protein FliM [Priestia megaterium]
MAGDVLSQNEIDALLSALSTGEMDADQLKSEDTKKRIRAYDFKRALRFSKDQIRSLTRIHENYARLLTTVFSAQLRTITQISVVSVDQIPYEEFIRSVPKMTILNVISVEPLEGRIIMEVNPNIAYAMLDRLLGGKGEAGNKKIEDLTEIETKLLRNLFDTTLDGMQEAWSSVAEIFPENDEFEVNPQFLQVISPNEIVVVISLNVQVGDETGMINLCIPHVTLEPIISKLSVHYWMQSSKKEPNDFEIEHLKKRIHIAEVPVIAKLGSTEISIQDFLALGAGDIIRLNTSVDEPLTVHVGELPKFIAQPGKAKKKLAIQILDEYQRGDQNYDR